MNNFLDRLSDFGLEASRYLALVSILAMLGSAAWFCVAGVWEFELGYAATVFIVAVALFLLAIFIRFVTED